MQMILHVCYISNETDKKSFPQQEMNEMILTHCGLVLPYGIKTILDLFH